MATVTATLTNTGTADLIVGTITIEGGGGVFAITNDEASGQTIAPAASETFDVVFEPGAAQAYSALLSIPTNDAASPLTVPLAGTGITAAAPAISVDPPTNWAAGAVDIDGGTAVRVFSVGNPGTADLHVGTVTKTGADFAKSSDTASGATITPGASKSFTITFDPTTTGAKTGSVTVPSDAGPNVVVALSGTGTEEAPEPYEVSRLYLTAQASGVGGGPDITWFDDYLWDDTSYLLSPVKQGPATVTRSYSNSAGSSGRRVGFDLHVSPPLAAQDLRGITFHVMAIPWRGESLGSNVTGVVWLAKRLANGTWVEIGGLQPASAVSPWAWAGDRSNRRLPGGGSFAFAIPSVAAAVLAAGDRLAVMMGARIFTATTGTVVVRIGGGSDAVDISGSQSTDTDVVHAPWMQFGSPLLVLP